MGADGLATADFSPTINYDLDDQESVVRGQRSGAAGNFHHRSSSLDWTALADASKTLPTSSDASVVKVLDVMGHRTRQARYRSL